ncbi:co-chaperone DjlA [Parahaliea sp. F7430]|uniref:Co-chaperone protein DjlA n=1 Tax=Sediminihaliea albiluteola TaxID=2758564 RepID=A0A7W2YKW5_9GAMM|nr:co-chaperone DjlA [Sediminihaliea albiluteola]MBA6413793.1 co-chaperone DjlA [Sediminihaliea albiluteola]
MFYGKVIAGLLGFLMLGPIGLILGVIIGHAFDRGLMQNLQYGSAENLARVKRSFFETSFLLQGFLAKADGRISEQEVAHTEQLMLQMGLNAEQRKEAIGLFKRGAAADFQLEPVLAEFLEICGSQKRLQHTLLMFLVSLALSDHQLDQAERDALSRIARLLSISQAELDQLLRMAQAQGQFHQHGGAGSGSQSSLDDAYAALGVSADISDKDLKRAYRKLMSEHHPDKLIAKGVPDDMVRVATEKSQEIQAAYEVLRKERGMR